MVLAVAGAGGFVQKWKRSGWFGIAVTLFFFLSGALLSVCQRHRTSYAWEQQEAVYRAVVQEVPRLGRKAWRAEVEVEAVGQADGGWKAVNRRVLLYWMPDSVQPPVACGDRLCFRARIERQEGRKDLTGFDYGRYLMHKGIAGTGIAYAGHWRRIGSDGQWSLRRQLLQAREGWVQRLRNGIGEGDELAVVAALTVGEKQELTGKLKSAYRAAGASHLLALSGLHVGILAALLTVLSGPLRRLKGGAGWQSLLVVMALWGYACLTGGSVSVVRAVVMFTLYIIARSCVESSFPGGRSLSLSAFLMLVCQPFYLFDVGFQLSFAAVFSILLCQPFLRRWTDGRNRVVCYFLQAAGISVAAQLGTLPLVLYYFGAFPSYFLLTNLVVVPMATVLLALALLVLVSGGLPAVEAVGMTGLRAVAKGMNTVMETVQQWEGAQLSSLYLSGMQAVGLAVLLLAGAAFLYVRRPRYLVTVLVAGIGLVGTGIWHRCVPERVSLHLYRGAVCAKRGRQVQALTDTVAGHHIYKVGQTRVAIVNDGQWWGKTAGKERLRIDYLYVCRGFRGTLRRLSGLFEVRRVVLDASLSSGQADRLRQECRQLGIRFMDFSEKGSCEIVPYNEK